MITAIYAATSVAGVLTQSSSSSESDNAIYLLLLGPIAGFLFYSSVYMRYRNTDKDNEYEVLTESQIGDVKGYDRKTAHYDRLTNSRIQGDNSRDPRQRLGSGTQVIRHD